MAAWLVVVHVVSAMVFVGGAILLNVLVFRVDGMGGAATFFKVVKATDPAINVAAPLMILSGIWLVLINEQFGFTTPFVVIGMAAIVVSALSGLFYFLKEIKNLGAMIETRGNEDKEVEERFQRFAVAWSALNVIYLAAAWAMIIKPEF